MRQNLIVAAAVAAVMAVFVLGYVALSGGAAPAGMGGTAAAPAQRGAVPPVKGYLGGTEIRFIHTEASDPQVAQMLTSMMGSPVLIVPSLAQVPPAALAKVYVFKNGMKGEGPFGFQPDVFDAPPTAAGYSPLRALNLVTWKDAAKARLLRSADEVRAADTAGEIAVERPGAVVNMPLLTWPGGQR